MRLFKTRKERKSLFVQRNFANFLAKAPFQNETADSLLWKKEISLVLHKQFKEKSWNYCLGVTFN